MISIDRLINMTLNEIDSLTDEELMEAYTLTTAKVREAKIELVKAEVEKYSSALKTHNETMAKISQPKNMSINVTRSYYRKALLANLSFLKNPTSTVKGMKEAVKNKMEEFTGIRGWDEEDLKEIWSDKHIIFESIKLITQISSDEIYEEYDNYANEDYLEQKVEELSEAQRNELEREGYNLDNIRFMDDKKYRELVLKVMEYDYKNNSRGSGWFGS